MNIRVKDHFSSAIILVSQGFTVDALSLTRASLEDLFVLLNFYIEPGYFDKWKANKSGFSIKPVELRSHPKIDANERELYKKVYKTLSNGIVHPRVNSLSHMLKCHPTAYAKGSEGIIRLKKDTKLISLSFFMYLHNLCTLFKTEYTNTTDVQNLVSFINELKSIELVKYFGDHPQELE